ncbi:unnamed protein product [Clavelina lepadiformis]|uniref:Uncharacterized protein n=1 Tax=Clavelina lepadiformis TaxID=159417 RepID=A0ABP0F296_CLALP
MVCGLLLHATHSEAARLVTLYGKADRKIWQFSMRNCSYKHTNFGVMACIKALMESLLSVLQRYVPINVMPKFASHQPNTYDIKYRAKWQFCARKLAQQRTFSPREIQHIIETSFQ